MTQTDTDFTARFSGMTASSFVANQSNIQGFVPTQSPINLGMYDDIGRATLYGYDQQPNFFSKFMRSPLDRGDAEMFARFSEVTSRSYDPLAADTALFDGQRPDMISSVAKKNLSRQIYTEINDRYLKQYVQTPEMINSAISILQASNMQCYLDDMWVASKTYFSGSVRDAKSTQMFTMTAKPTDAGFAEEFNELLYQITQNKFKYKSTLYNASGYNTCSKQNGVTIGLTQSVSYPAFKKFYAETFNPTLLDVPQTADYVDSWATPAGAPSGAGELIGIVVDNRAWTITPMPEALSTEAFRNPVRKSTSFATTYEYAFNDAPFFNKAYIFAPQ